MILLRNERAEKLALNPDLSWKVRYRTLLWFLSQMIKLYRARSLLYRRQILQENIRWKALDEIYKIYMFLHRSDLNISAKLCQIVYSSCLLLLLPPGAAYPDRRTYAAPDILEAGYPHLRKDFLEYKGPNSECRHKFVNMLELF